MVIGGAFREPTVEHQVAIVDDSEVIRTEMLRFLRTVGFTAVAFRSAEDFLASDSLGRIGCLLLDVQMPGMSGVQLQEHLLQLRCAVPVVFMTAINHPALGSKLLAAGAHRVLWKPSDAVEIIEAVSSALRTSNSA